MKIKVLLFSIYILLASNCFSQAPNFLWAKQQDSGGSSNDDSKSVAMDASGNVIVTGFFYSPSITFGTTNLTNEGNADIFIAKYDPNGNLLWAKQQDSGGTAQDYARCVATDASGNVIVAGNFLSPSITFGTTTLTNAGISNVFIVKYDPNGNVLWAKQQNAGGTVNDYIFSIATDANGNVIVSGFFDSPNLTFGTTNLTNEGNEDIFIVKYDPNGNVLWAKQQDAGGTNTDGANCTAIDASGNVIVTGNFDSPTITFGTTTLTSTGVSVPNFFIVKYDTNGNVLWAKQGDLSGTSISTTISVATDAIGNVIVTGNFLGPTVTFGTTTLTNAGISANIFVVKYDPNGNVLWAKQQDSGGTDDDDVSSVSADASGNLFVTGSFSSPNITFGTTTLTNAGAWDIFIVKYDPNGNVLWAKQQDAGGAGFDVANSIVADANGNVIVTGKFYNFTLTFGTTTLTNVGIFVIKLNENTTSTNEDALTNEVCIYPNPTKGLTFLSSNYSITLTTLTGIIITKEKNTNAFDISNQPPGMYFVSLTNEKGQIVQRSKVTKE